jgi:hypothetical protein
MNATLRATLVDKLIEYIESGEVLRLNPRSVRKLARYLNVTEPMASEIIDAAIADRQCSVDRYILRLSPGVTSIGRAMTDFNGLEVE